MYFKGRTAPALKAKKLPKMFEIAALVLEYELYTDEASGDCSIKNTVIA
jgi:hypothetical protein